MFCIYCGVENPNQSRFCAACGKAIELAKGQEPQDSEDPAMQQGPLHPTPSGAGATGPDPEPESSWHYLADGTQIGPLSRADFHSAISSGVITGATSVWRPGLAAWQPARKRAELAGVLNAAEQTGPAAEEPACEEVERRSRRRTTKRFAIASFVLGILNLYTLGLLFVGALVAIILGVIVLFRWAKSPAYPGKLAQSYMAMGGILLSLMSVTIVPIWRSPSNADSRPWQIPAEVASGLMPTEPDQTAPLYDEDDSIEATISMTWAPYAAGPSGDANAGRPGELEGAACLIAHVDVESREDGWMEIPMLFELSYRGHRVDIGPLDDQAAQNSNRDYIDAVIVEPGGKVTVRLETVCVPLAVRARETIEVDYSSPGFFRFVTVEPLSPRAINAVGAKIWAGQLPLGEAEAFHWFRTAAELGDPGAQLNLGSLYRAGKLVPRDIVQAYAWLNASLAQGGIVSSTPDDVKNLLDEMTPTQRENAEQLARDYQKKYVVRGK